MKNSFLEGFLFRPQGKPMAYPYTLPAMVSQFPWRHAWHNAFIIRFMAYTTVFIIVPIYWQIDKKLTSKENKELWKNKRKHDAEHHRREMEKLWEVRT